MKDRQAQRASSSTARWGRHVLLVCALARATAVSAQGDRVHVSRYTVDDGLAQNLVTALVQDSAGFIWIGTNRGRTRQRASSMVAAGCARWNRLRILAGGLLTQRVDSGCSDAARSGRSSGAMLSLTCHWVLSNPSRVAAPRSPPGALRYGPRRCQTRARRADRRVYGESMAATANDAGTR
jgi:hypothetical protein